jgi:uncharacterized Zn-binding protein involved in type VI secretion
MSEVCRVGDNANCPADSHGKNCCSHNVTGPAVNGSPNVVVNASPVLRIGDSGVHTACCGSNTWTCAEGSESVLINGLPAVRLGDATSHCGGEGKMVTASADVIIG